MSLEKTIYLGPFVHSVSLKELEVCPKGAIGVDETGVICFVERDVEDVKDLVKKQDGAGWADAKVVKIEGEGWFFPGFVDTHTHASQHPNTGLFGKSTLLDWLSTYTFPLESSLSSLTKAAHVYTNFVLRTLSHGTTTCCYYATIHVPSTNLLAKICHEKGQRAFVGRVCMNTLSPDYYRDVSVSQGISDSLASITYIRTLSPTGLIQPIITPRFAPSCTSDSLAALGALHKQTNAHIQTHISENLPEIALVQELFPSSTSYADVYDTAGLLTPKTILAHAVHLTPAEITLIRTRNAKISHCPASNTALTSGCCPVRSLLNADLTIGLGTDVSGGFSPSILEECRQAIWVSRHVAMTQGDEAKLSTEEVLYLATRGGAAVCGLEDTIGGFEVGKEWDAQMVKLGVVARPQTEVDGEVGEGQGNAVEGMKHEGKLVHGPVDVFGWESWEDKVHKWVYSGDDRNTVAVWVRGRLVHKTDLFEG